MDHWEGGKMTYINGRFMLGHLKKNYQGLFDHGIRPVGNYLDVFGYVPPDEDFNPQHPTTRTECMKERAKCYIWSRSHLGFVGTEAACDWTVPFADISVAAETKGRDPCAVVQPGVSRRDHDAVRLEGFAWPVKRRRAANPCAESRQPPLEKVRRMATLQKRFAHAEMTDHEFLDKDRRKEQTTFADGTTVTVDWDTKTAKIEPDR